MNKKEKLYIFERAAALKVETKGLGYKGSYEGSCERYLEISNLIYDLNLFEEFMQWQIDLFGESILFALNSPASGYFLKVNAWYNTWHKDNVENSLEGK